MSAQAPKIEQEGSAVGVSVDKDGVDLQFEQHGCDAACNKMDDPVGFHGQPVCEGGLNYKNYVKCTQSTNITVILQN